MPEFENQFQDKPSLARPIPGVIAQQMATMAEIGLRWLGCNLYQHEKDGLADFFGGPLRAWPKLGDYFQQSDPPT